MKISNLYGKRIESEDKKRCGVIMAICCAENVIDGYICFDEDEKEFFASACGTRVLKDKVTFTKLGKEKKNSFRLRLGVPVFSQEGKHVGNVTDCSVMGGKLCTVFIKNKKYSAEEVCVSDAVIIKPSAGKAEAERAAKDMFIGALCGN
ncbi:MAG: hypothetical protein ACI4MC_02220 [Candidatus Coproplasma sp.]